MASEQAEHLGPRPRDGFPVPGFAALDNAYRVPGPTVRLIDPVRLAHAETSPLLELVEGPRETRGKVVRRRSGRSRSGSVGVGDALGPITRD